MIKNLVNIYIIIFNNDIILNLIFKLKYIIKYILKYISYAFIMNSYLFHNII